MQVMQVKQVSQLMQVLQAEVSQRVNQSLSIILDLTNYNCYRCINSAQWLLFICFQRFTFEWQCCKSNQWIKILTLTLCVIPNQIILHMCYFHSVAPCLKQCQTKPVNKGSDSNSVCYTKPNHFTHVLFSRYSSLSQAKSNQTKCSTMSSLQIKWFNKYNLHGNTKPNNSAHMLFFTL